MSVCGVVAECVARSSSESQNKVCVCAAVDVVIEGETQRLSGRWLYLLKSRSSSDVWIMNEAGQ